MLAIALPGRSAAVDVAAPPAQPRRVLKVCADPNNLPFSNERREGFEDRIAELLARDLDADLKYTWWAQRRGFVRETLRAKLCDVVLGVPTSFERALVTRPYYRSSYVFVTRTDRALGVRSFDDEALRKLKIGVQLVGDDYSNPPPAHALARRGIVQNVVGYTIYGDYAHEPPTAAVIDAVVRGDVDVAVVWGPLGGWLARRSAVPLSVQPVQPQIDLPFLPFVFDIAMGVRRGEDALKGELDAFLLRRRGEIDAILRSYGVPLLATGARRTAS